MTASCYSAALTSTPPSPGLLGVHVGKRLKKTTILPGSFELVALLKAITQDTRSLILLAQTSKAVAESMASIGGFTLTLTLDCWTSLSTLLIVEALMLKGRNKVILDTRGNALYFENVLLTKKVFSAFFRNIVALPNVQLPPSTDPKGELLWSRIHRLQDMTSLQEISLTCDLDRKLLEKLHLVLGSMNGTSLHKITVHNNWSSGSGRCPTATSLLLTLLEVTKASKKKASSARPAIRLHGFSFAEERDSKTVTSLLVDSQRRWQTWPLTSLSLTSFCARSQNHVARGTLYSTLCALILRMPNLERLDLSGTLLWYTTASQPVSTDLLLLDRIGAHKKIKALFLHGCGLCFLHLPAIARMACHRGVFEELDLGGNDLTFDNYMFSGYRTYWVNLIQALGKTIRHLNVEGCLNHGMAHDLGMQVCAMPHLKSLKIGARHMSGVTVRRFLEMMAYSMIGASKEIRADIDALSTLACYMQHYAVSIKPSTLRLMLGGLTHMVLPLYRTPPFLFEPEFNMFDHVQHLELRLDCTCSMKEMPPALHGQCFYHKDVVVWDKEMSRKVGARIAELPSLRKVSLNCTRMLWSAVEELMAGCAESKTLTHFLLYIDRPQVYTSSPPITIPSETGSAAALETSALNVRLMCMKKTGMPDENVCDVSMDISGRLRELLRDPCKFQRLSYLQIVDSGSDGGIWAPVLVESGGTRVLDTVALHVRSGPQVCSDRMRGLYSDHCIRSVYDLLMDATTTFVCKRLVLSNGFLGDTPSVPRAPVCHYPKTDDDTGPVPHIEALTFVLARKRGLRLSLQCR